MNYARTKSRFQYTPFIDIGDVSRNQDILLKTRLLIAGEFGQVRSLMSLHCDVSPAWSKRVLEQAAPRLQMLVVHAPSEAHLQVMKGMPQLRRLCFTSAVAEATLPLHLEELYFKTVTREQLAQVKDAARCVRGRVGFLNGGIKI